MSSGSSSSRRLPKSVVERLASIDLHDLEDELYSSEEEEEEEVLKIEVQSTERGGPCEQGRRYRLPSQRLAVMQSRVRVSQGSRSATFEPPPGLTASQRLAALRRYSDKMTLEMQTKQDLDNVRARCRGVAEACMRALLSKSLSQSSDVQDAIINDAAVRTMINADAGTGEGADWGPVCSLFHANDFEDASGRIAFIDFQFRQVSLSDGIWGGAVGSGVYP